MLRELLTLAGSFVIHIILSSYGTPAHNCSMTHINQVYTAHINDAVVYCRSYKGSFSGKIHLQLHGFGKSLCYACLPMVFNFLFKPSQSSIVCVVTPLTAILEDQVYTV